MTEILKRDLKKIVLSILMLPIYFQSDIQAQSKWQADFGSRVFTREIGGEDAVFRFGGDGKSEVRTLSVTYQNENNIWYSLSYDWGESGISTNFLFNGSEVLPHRSEQNDQIDNVGLQVDMGVQSLTGSVGRFFNIHKSFSVIPSVGLALTSLRPNSRGYGTSGRRSINGSLFNVIETPMTESSRSITPLLILANRFEFEILPNVAIFYDIGWRLRLFSEFQTLDQSFPGESGSVIEKRFVWNGSARMRSSGITWKFLGKRKSRKSN